MKALLLLVMTLLVTQGALAQVEGGLSEADARLLKSLDMEIAVPTYLPDGFRVARVLCTLDRSGYGGPSYRIIYATRDRRAFVVEGVSEEVMRPEADKELPVVNPVYGESFVGLYKFEGTTTASGDWLGKGPYYRVRPGDRRNSAERRYDGSLTPETLGKVHASLVPLR